MRMYNILVRAAKKIKYPKVRSYLGHFIFSAALMLAVPAGCLNGCATPDRSARAYIAAYGNPNPVPRQFNICYTNACRKTMPVSLQPQQWDRVRALFTPASADAETERERLRQAIALLEIMVGELTGASKDKGGFNSGEPFSVQFDCIDEAVNTSTYLTMMEDDGLIHHHTFHRPALRGYFIGGWPHFATVMVDNRTQARFAIDSWFLDNGDPPFILPLRQWKSGWRPQRVTD